MNIPFFTPKAAASTLVGVGSMGGGGGAVYLYQMPKNWKDLLIKEGYVFLGTDEDYKGMFNDQKDDSNWQAEDSLKDAQESDVKTKTSTYCNGKFSTTLPSSSSDDYSTTKQKLIAFCTTEGIKTVKARLIQSKQDKWIKQENEDEKWKTVFAVYKYNNEFIAWLKQDSSDDNLDQNSKATDKYSTLKTACSNLLKKSHKEITNRKLFDYGSWWCVDLEYTTIKEKIQKDDSTWQEKSQSDSDWDNLKTQWANTDQVKKWANKAKSSSDENSDLDVDGLKALCKSDTDGQGVKSKLYEEDNYKEKYQVIKAVCKSTTASSQK